MLELLFSHIGQAAAHEVAMAETPVMETIDDNLEGLLRQLRDGDPWMVMRNIASLAPPVIQVACW